MTGLRENMAAEPVSALALREPVTAPADATIRAAISKMRARNLGCVVIVDDQGRPEGMFTESMLTQILAQGGAQLDARLGDHMARQWPRIRASDPIEGILDALDLKNVRFLCVVDDQGRLVGLTGQKGLMEYVADHFPCRVMVQPIGGGPCSLDREGA